MKKVIGLIALAGVTAVACSVGTQEKEPSVGKTESASSLTANRIWGAAGVKDAFVVTWNAAQTSTANNVSYQIALSGTTTAQGPSFVAEESLRSGSTIADPDTSSLYQSVSPMSREFVDNNNCVNGSGQCCTGERTNLVGYGAVDVLVRSTGESVTNITAANMKAIFCGDDDGVAATSYPLNCSSSFSTWPSTGTGIRVRPDFDTEAMDQLRRFAGCKADKTRDIFAFCQGVLRVSRASGSLAVLQSNGDGEEDVVTTDFVGESKPCATGDSATVCIGKIAASTVSSNRYLGFADRQSGGVIASDSKLLTVGGVARGTTTDVTNIRNLSYPLAYKLFLNENTDTASDAKETLFYNRLYKNQSSAKSTWDTTLENAGFVKCSDSVALGCGNGVCPTANGSNVNDGRGVGACTDNSRCERL